MNSKAKQLIIALLSAASLFAVVVALSGCKKSEPPVQPETETKEVVSGTKKVAAEAEKIASEAKQVSSEAEQAIASTVEQTICPVMGGAINKEIFTDYKGKKVYFCCASCKTEFEKNPEQYIAKLPQFKK